MIGNYLRYLGMMLLMLVLGSFLQLLSMEPSSDAFAAGCHDIRIASVHHGDALNRSANSDPAANHFSSHALHQNTSSSVFHRPQPGIFMIPRMNRVPKPKSVYRNFARAPGTPLVFG